MKKTKARSKGGLYSINIISIILCIIAIALMIVTCIIFYNGQKNYSKKMLEIDKRIVTIASYETGKGIEEELNNIYLDYYNQIDQKATEAINVVLAFLGVVFSLTTIVNTIISVRIPKQFEDKLYEMDKKIEDIERRAIRTIALTMNVESTTAHATTREKISAITEIIDTLGDKAGEFVSLRGFLYNDLKEFDHAKADYKQAKKLGGSEDLYHNRMGVLYTKIMLSADKEIEKSNALKKAENHYKKAIELAKKHNEETSNYHCNLACLYQDFGISLKKDAIGDEVTKYFTLALEEFDAAIADDPENLVAYLNRGISHIEKGEAYYLDAYDDFLICRSIDSDNERVLRELADIALKLYDKTGEVRFYQEAKRATSKLRQEVNRLDELQDRINIIEKKASFHREGIVAKIDEKIADLSVKEAKEHKSDSKEYSDGMAQAIMYYKSAIEAHEKLQREENNSNHEQDIERIREKLKSITENDIGKGNTLK